MNNLRLSEKNKVKLQIKNIEQQIQIDNNNINYRKKKLRADDIFNLNQIQKFIQKNEKRNEELTNLKDRLNRIQNGEFDDEFIKIQQNNKVIAENKEMIKKNKKIEIIRKKELNKQKLQEYYNKEKKNNRQNRISEKEMYRSYNYYIKCVDSIPSYIDKKLQNMPNNKGYIWRGVHCYGYNKSEINKPRLMFEKKNNIHITHEKYNNRYKIWHKDSNNRKKLYYVQPIRHKKNGFNLLDFVK
jgi:hypothetical protein